MAQRSIEEVFRTIAPSRRRGIPNPAPIGEGFTSNGGDSSSSLSQVGNEIAQLRSVYQQQHDLIAANTQAVQNNTSAKGSTSAAGAVGNVASSLFGGALGFLSPVISGLMGLFKGGGSTPATLPVYTPPPPVSLDGMLRTPAASNNQQGPNAVTTPQQSVSTNLTTNTNQTTNANQTSNTNQMSSSNQTTYSPQITVQVNAMDSQSFMDRSHDIASAVREAMLNNHPINGVVTDL
jgi:hypothetical protein